jgi:oxalate decarboxylase
LAPADNGDSSEFNTLLVTDWLAHTPPEVLAKNFGLPVDAFKNISLHDKWIYQSNIPAPPLEKVEDQIAAAAGKPPNPYIFRRADFKPLVDTKSGSVRLADSTNFLVWKTIAATVVTIKPGGLRDMHWHPNADEWNYWIKGEARNRFQHRAAGDHRKLSFRRHRLRQKGVWTLCREYRGHGSCVHGSLQSGSV